MPNTTSIDVNFPICLKCAAIDRARLATSPPIQRSVICQECFNRYCFNPFDPPTNKDLPGRKLIFVDPTPSSLSKAELFITKHGIPLFVVLGIVLVLSITLCGFWFVLQLFVYQSRDLKIWLIVHIVVVRGERRSFNW